MGGWLPNCLVAVRHLVPSSLALEFSDDTGAVTDDYRIGARDYSRIQESAMLRALQRGSYVFRATQHEQFDPGQQVDLHGWLPGCRAIRPATERNVLSPFRLANCVALFLREGKTWENTLESGNVKFLAKLPTPESQSALKDELKTYLPDAELQKVIAHRGDKEAFILHWQYEAVSDLYNKKLISEYILVVLTSALDDLARLQGGLKRIKNYPYARNYYSIAVILVKIFVAIVPFGLFPYAQELGKSAGIEHWTAWLNVPFSVIVGWSFVALEKVGENSSNPFEGGANDVPISSIARRIEIEMRTMLGEQTDLKPIEAKYNILF